MTKRGLIKKKLLINHEKLHEEKKKYVSALILLPIKFFIFNINFNY